MYILQCLQGMSAESPHVGLFQISTQVPSLPPHISSLIYVRHPNGYLPRVVLHLPHSPMKADKR